MSICTHIRMHPRNRVASPSPNPSPNPNPNPSPNPNPNPNLGLDQIGSEAHMSLALEAARQSTGWFKCQFSTEVHMLFLLIMLHHERVPTSKYLCID